MRCTRSWTKRPREALLLLAIGSCVRMFRVGGSRKAPMRHHPYVHMTLYRGPHKETRSIFDRVLYPVRETVAGR